VGGPVRQEAASSRVGELAAQTPGGAAPSNAMPSGPVRRPPHEFAFAAAIRARIEAGRTQADVAEKAGLPARTVQPAEQGIRHIYLDEAALRGITRAFPR